VLAGAVDALAALPTEHCMLGAYANPANARLTAAESVEALAVLERRVGRRLEIASSFLAWNEPFPNRLHELERDAGRRPLVAWYAPDDLAAIAAGDSDELLRTRAADCRAFGAPLFLRWGAEFNGAWNIAYGKQRQFVAAWRHIVRTFRSEGATNVRFVWCPFASDVRRASDDDWRGYYPGDAYVDWIGMDGYNWGTTRSWSSWQSFATIFGPLYRDATRRKPVMVCELGSAEHGGDKAAWIADMGRQLAGPFHRVRGLVWFDVNKETDWRIDSSPSALAAFRKVVDAPRYG
jgi:hypothetical protein